MSFKLKLIKKMAEKISEKQDINWESWDDEECEMLELYNVSLINAFEDLFAEDPNILEKEDPDYVDGYLDTLLNSYVIFNVLNRKREIEELIRLTQI